MNRYQVLGVCALWLTTGSNARAVAIGPYEDFRGVVVGSATASMIMTGVYSGGWNLKDAGFVEVALGSPDAYLRGAAFATSATPDFAGPVTITTIYGVDVDPAGTPLLIGGFNPVDPEVDSIFDEMYFATLSGTWYPATVALTPSYSDLPVLLPGFDLSPFTGSSDSFFYLFQATVPGSEFQFVPEPSTLVLGTIGLGLMLARLVVRQRGQGPASG